MKKLIVLLMVLLLTVALVGCKKSEETNHKEVFDNADYWMIEVAERKRTDDGYAYRFKEIDGMEYDEWYNSSELFSVGEVVLTITYEDELGNEHLLFYDFEEIENDIPQQYYSKDEVEDVSHELDMTVALYEAKLDWYEEQHNIDLDDVPNDFILWLIEEHPEVYAYWLERVEGN